MILFEAREIHNVHKDTGEVGVRIGPVIPRSDEYDYFDAMDSLAVAGLKPNEFALSATVIDFSAGATDMGYLVTDRNRKTSTIVNVDKVLKNPDDYVTLHLANLLRSVDPTELEQFSIDAIMNHIYRTFDR